MSKEKSFAEQRKEREREDEGDPLDRNIKAERQARAEGREYSPELAEQQEARLDETLAQVEPLIDQLNQLYQQFAGGGEKRPPTEKRRMLDRLMLQLQTAQRPTSVQQFRYQSLKTRYVTYRDRWDRILKETEVGKKK